MQTLYFYDLETSGFNPRTDRIMQFGGQRTDLQLRPIGEPFSFLIGLSDDILPSPDAIMLTGITPQSTKQEGLKEAEFIKIFNAEISTPGTIFVGFNNIRFDDEFMRFLNWRNYNDPYEWQWKDNRSRWDMLDVVRMARALRPDGIKWPFDSRGLPANRLELLTSVNGLDHSNAHDALSDVQATIELARLIYKKQPKLFSFMLEMRDKKKIAALVDSGQPFVYTSGKYDSASEKTTIAAKLCNHPHKQGSVVFDLREDPLNLSKLSAEEIVKKWQYNLEEPDEKLPLKTLLYNRCPAISPIGVMDKKSQKRLQLNMDQISNNYKNLADNKDKICKTVLKALDIMNKKQQTSMISDNIDAESKLYDGFVDDKDRALCQKVLNSKPEELEKDKFIFNDERLNDLFLSYKARNFPKLLSDSERKQWEERRIDKLKNSKFNLKQYMDRLNELAQEKSLSKEKLFILEELKLYAESLLPSPIL